MSINNVYSLQNNKWLFSKFSPLISQINNWNSRHAGFLEKTIHKHCYLSLSAVSCIYSPDSLFNESSRQVTNKIKHSITEHVLVCFVGSFFPHLSPLICRYDCRMKLKSYRSLPATPAEIMCTWVESGLKILISCSLQFE